MLLTILIADVSAGDPVKRVVFPKGKNSVVYKGKLPGAYANYNAYLIRLKKGQRLSVKLTANDEAAYFMIFETEVLDPSEDLIYDSRTDSAEFSGKMPVNGDYSIQIYGVGEVGGTASRAPYSIEIAVTK